MAPILMKLQKHFSGGSLSLSWTVTLLIPRYICVDSFNPAHTSKNNPTECDSIPRLTSLSFVLSSQLFSLYYVIFICVYIQNNCFPLYTATNYQ